MENEENGLIFKAICFHQMKKGIGPKNIKNTQTVYFISTNRLGNVIMTQQKLAFNNNLLGIRHYWSIYILSINNLKNKNAIKRSMKCI